MMSTPKINTNMFHFDKEFNEFTQEISSLAWTHAFNSFILVSQRTGSEVPFKLSSIEKSEEGEIQCWNFKALSPFQILQNMTVTVFND